MPLRVRRDATGRSGLPRCVLARRRHRGPDRRPPSLQAGGRRLKTLTSHRSVPLWPQAEAILRVYFADKERDGGLGRLLFPSPVSRSEALITDFRKALDVVAGRCGWEKGEIRSKMFRHTYCSARLQTLDGGAPVSPFTVGKDLGHGGTSMVERVYRLSPRVAR